METLKFEIQINAPKKKVSDTMLHPETYQEWTNVSWPGSRFEGEWKEGNDLRFVASGQGGTLGTLTKHTPYEETLATHVAVINADGSEDRGSEAAKGWIGTTERYLFNERDGVTSLTVEIKTPAAWASMFREGWPGALEKLKEICER